MPSLEPYLLTINAVFKTDSTRDLGHFWDTFCTGTLALSADLQDLPVN
jgi:hypothetical protein